MALVFDQFICRSDNFGVLVHDRGTGVTASIDAPDAAAIEARLQALGWTLDLILVTHHHSDHTAGIRALKATHGCTVVAPAAEAASIPAIDRIVVGGETVAVGDASFMVIETPGHTAGHVAYWSESEAVVFAGDTLFSLGCGRVMEAPYETMWESLVKLKDLPRETVVYCGHEYTEANGRFAMTIEPNNLDLQARVEEVGRLVAAGEATLPTTIGAERSTNPFLRADKPRLRRALGMEDATAAEVFTELRKRKDAFRG